MNPELQDAELLALAEAEGVETAEWQTLSFDVRQAMSVSDTLSDDFTEKLKSAAISEAERENAGASAPQSFPIRNRFAFPRPIAAAAAAVALIAVGVYLGREPSVAWGDVVRATKSVQQCHILIFDDSPRAVDTDRRNARIDWYFRSPDQWRVHGMNRVAFVADGQSKTWDAEMKNWANDKIELLPRSLRNGVKNGDVLTALLTAMFNGNPPAGEPVKSDDVSSAEGIDVFDYARDSGRQWARIWVLRDSRLPIRAHVYAPQSDAFSLVDFDYSDPQPPAFFDPAEFEKAVAQTKPATARQAFAIGQRPVNGNRPRGSNQVYETAGGYHAPAIKELFTNADGDLLIVHDDVSNLTPTGLRAEVEGYAVTDTWGNRYFTSGGRGDFKTHRSYFSPVPPFKTAAGPRQIKLDYRIQPTLKDTPQSLRTDTLDAPPPTTDAKAFTEDFAREKPTWHRHYLDAVGTLAQKLTAIEDRLAANPDDVPTLAWQFTLFRQHGRDAAAWTLFETKLRDPFFAEPLLLNQYYIEASQYLLYLADTGREAEAKSLAGRVQSFIETAEKQTGQKRWPVAQLTRKESNPLRTAVAALAWREKFREQPTVKNVVASTDGYVFIEAIAPTPPAEWQATGSVGNAPLGWFYTPTPPAGWQEAARFVDAETGRMMLAYRGTGATLPLAGEVVLAPDNYSGAETRHDLKLPWRRDTAVPTPTVDSMRDYWSIRTRGQRTAMWYANANAAAPTAPRPAEALLSKAENAPPAEAYSLVEQALKLPKDKWADYLSHPANAPDAFERAVRNAHADQATRLAKLGRYDEARAIAAALWAEVPTPMDYSDESQVTIADKALRASLAVPRAMLDAGDTKAAAAALEAIAARRPNLADIPDGMKMVDRGASRITFMPRDRQKDAWQAFDRLWWDVQDALKK